MRIWYIHPYAGGPGLGRYFRPYMLARHWSAQGNEAHVFTAAYHHLLHPDVAHAGHERHGGVDYQFVYAPRYRGNSLSRLWSMFLFSVCLIVRGLRHCREHGRPDLIVYSSPHPYAFPSSWLLARFCRARLFFEVRDLWPLSLVELAGLSRFNPLVILTGWIEKWAYRRSDCVISLLPDAESYMRQRGLRPGRYKWIPNGIDPSEVSELACRDEEKHDLVARVAELKSRGHFVVLYAGGHGSPNALDVLLKAAQIVETSKAGPARFLLVGAGEKKAELMSWAAGQGLSNVEFHEPVPKQVIMQVMKACSAGYVGLVASKVFQFGVSPNKLWDYMLCGLPVIYACGGSNDPVKVSGCGVSAEAGNAEAIAAAIERLMCRSPKELEAMGLLGFRYVTEQLTYEHLARRYVGDAEAQ